MFNSEEGTQQNTQELMEEKEPEKKLDPFTEFETKYESSLSILPIFQKLADAIPDRKSFIYAEGPDEYYTKPEDPICLRFRKAVYPEATPQFKQLTTKGRPIGAKHNIKRKEPNLLVNSSDEEIRAFIESVGYKFNFKVYKRCHIQSFEDAVIVFYSLMEDGKTTEEYFIEIEVNEETIHQLTENEAWKVIEKYEKILAETGITPQKRLKLSILERYRTDKVK